MTKRHIEWVTGTPTRRLEQRSLEHLPWKYLQGVFKNFLRGDTIAFGTTGTEAKVPYYELKRKGEKFAYNGKSHKLDPITDKFNDNNLSKEFSWEELMAVYDNVRRRNTTRVVSS